MADNGEDADVAARIASQELIDAVMARMIPAMQQMFTSSSENASSPAPAPAPTATYAIPATPATHAVPAAPFGSSSTLLALPDPSVVSLEISDVDVSLDPLQRDLTAAADTFLLDHLDDDAGFPTYDAFSEPDHVPSLPSWNPEVLRSPRSASLPSPSPSPSPYTTSARADPNVLLATPARPWGFLRPPTGPPVRSPPGLPRRASASAPMVMPGASPTLPPFQGRSTFEPSANMVVYHPGPGLAPQRHGLGSPYYPLESGGSRACLVSPSVRPIVVDTDVNWPTSRDFFPLPYRLDDISDATQVGPGQVPAFKSPARAAAFGPPPAIVWPDPAIAQASASFRLSTGVVTHCQYNTYVEGFPHPYSRGSYHPADKSKQQSGSRYYIVFYGHEVGIFKSWGGCWVRTCDYPGARFMAVDHYVTALYLLWVSDAYRSTDVERRICSESSFPRAPYQRWPRFPHPMEVEARTIPELGQFTLSPEEALDSTLDEDDDDAEVRPIPMVNVKLHSDDDDDDDLSSYMEVSQFAIPAPLADDFIPVVRRSSQHRSSGQSIRSSQTTMTNDSFALQQAFIESTQNATELASKFDSLKKPEDFDWWLLQTKNRLEHEAWGGILDQGEPYVTTSENRSLSIKLGQRINACMNASIGDSIGGIQDYAGKGLEMFQAIIDHFVPTASVNLPSIFREWNELHQAKDELAVVFGGRVIKLANRSKRAGQEYTEVSKILTFVDGLHEGFKDFAKDYFSGRICLTETNLRDTTAYAKQLESTMEKQPNRTREPRRGRARQVRSGGTPDNDSVDVSSGPLSRAQVDALFANFKCPLHRVNNHTCLDCFAFGDQGYVITKKAAGAGRRVSGPTEVTPQDAPIPAPAPAPAPAPDPAPPPAPAAAPTDTVVGAGNRVTFDPSSAENNDDDVSVASSVEDFGVNYVMGSAKRVGHGQTITVPRLYTPKSYEPYRRKSPRTQSSPAPPASTLPQLWCLVALLLLIVGYSCLSPTLLGSTASMLGLLGSLRSRPASHSSISQCVGDARMARAISNGSLGRIQRATSSPSAYACIDSGCTQDMVPMRQSFLTYTPLKECHVTIANSEKIPCAGRGTVLLTLRDKTVKLSNVLHVPDLEMTLLSVRSHRRRGQGCSFIADESGCFLTFPSFVLDIDDADDCVIPCSLANPKAAPDYCERTQHHGYRASRADTFRFSAKRARGTLLQFSEGSARRTGVPPRAEHDPAELLVAPSPSKVSLPASPALERRIPPPVRPCEIPESSAAATIRYTPQQLHRLLGCRNLPDYKQLQSLGTGIQVVDTGDPPLSLGSVVNVQRGRKGRSISRPPRTLDTVGMDICYGDGVSPGGYSYCLMLVETVLAARPGSTASRI
jgi:hypothetical protein